MRHCVVVCGLLLGLWATPAMAGTEIDAAKLEALRTAGTTEIVPSVELLAEIDDDVDVLSATVKVCLDAKGKVKSVALARSSGVRSYDSLLVVTVRESWAFRPYKRKKKAIAVCSTVELSYQVPQPPPPPAADQSAAPSADQPKVANVAPSALEAVRITGNKNIVPDDATKVEIQKAGKLRLVIPIKICIAETGAVKRVSILKSSGFPGYDAKIKAAILSWTYQPFLVDGVAKVVCSAITLIYVQKA